MPIRRRTYRRRAAPARGRKLNPRQKKQVKRIVGAQQELKYLDTVTNAYSISTSGAIFQLCSIPQGDTDISRDGDRVYLKKMYVRGTVRVNDETNIVRLIFFQWKPNTAATIAQILLNGPSGSPDVQSNYAHDQRQMYKILYDKTWVLAGPGTTPETPVTPTTTRHFQCILSRGLIRQLQFTAGTTTGTNQIYYLALSDSSIGAHPTLSMSTKVMFTDS